MKHGVDFVSYVPGAYFGELDVLWGRLRENSARTREASELLVLNKPHFLEMLEKYPDIRTEVVEIAHIREARNEQAFQTAQGYMKKSVMQDYFHSSSSHHQGGSREMRKRVSWSILKRENNRTRWEAMKTLDTPGERTSSSRHRHKEVSRVLLVSAQQRFVPMELEARLGFVRRKKKALIDKSTSKSLPVPQEILRTAGVLRGYEALLAKGMLRIATRLNHIESQQAELEELAERL